jgi:hypothetical protein
MYFLHYDEESGDILAILNADKHTLKTPNIPVSAQKRDMIVKNPSQFIIKNRMLLNVSKPTVDSSIQETEDEHKRCCVDSKIRGYVDESGICWMSDDSALMELNLALNICSLDKNFVPKIHCMINGTRTLKEVDIATLQDIAKQIYSVRMCADDIYLTRMNELKNIQTTAI